VDPGFGVLVDAFTEGARKLGFPTRREMVPISQLNGWQIFSRYYIADNQNFPSSAETRAAATATDSPFWRCKTGAAE
jgi:hypothetical protein